MRRIRHFGRSTYSDLVTTVPLLWIDIPFFAFYHVGVHLQLNDDKSPRFSYPRNGETPEIDMDEDKVTFITHSQYSNLHPLDTCIKRLDKGKDELKDVFIDELYTDPIFVSKCLGSFSYFFFGRMHVSSVLRYVERSIYCFIKEMFKCVPHCCHPFGCVYGIHSTT